jgi:uncharacterized protein YdeI (YjbR/CyaY-like superfamily)
MVPSPPKPQLHVESAEALERWIEANPHSVGVRLRLRKKTSLKAAPTYDEALDVALCYGWIDGQTGRIDEDFYEISFTPRRARSVWSQRNRDLVARLTELGRMQPGGIAEVEKAKADGRWDAAYRQKDAVVPDDLQAALDASPEASSMFGRLTSQNRWAILYRLTTVKRAATRAARIAAYVEMLERGETIYPQNNPTRT